MSDLPPAVPPATPPPPGTSSYTPPPPPPPPPGGTGGGSAPGSDRGIMLVLSYLGILALIPLLTKKEDSEVQWHAKNGLALAIAWFFFWIAYQIVLHFMPGILGCGVWMLGCVIAIGYLVVVVLAIVKAINGQRLRIPVISDFADKM